MLKIELTKEQMMSVKNEDFPNVDGEEWEFECIDGEEEDEQGKYYYCIYKRPSDNKYFRVSIFYCRYGYKDYGYESDRQDNIAYEVEKKEIIRTEWLRVK